MRKAVNTKKGFSIGEVLIAMFILLVGIVDAVFLTVRSIDDLGDSRDSIVATLLAQEGTELVRNVRDNNVTEPAVGTDPADNDCAGNRCLAFESHTNYMFPSDTAGASPDGAMCRVDYHLGYDATGSLQCTGDRSPILYFNESSGLYGHKSGGNIIKKGYERQIYIKYGPSTGRTDDNRYADVTSIVIFGKGNWSDIDPSNPEDTCLKSRNCAYAQTRLTSWINYGD